MGTVAERVSVGGGPHRRVEQARRESEGKYRALVENSLQGIVVIQDRRLRFANAAAAAIVGAPVRQLLRLSFHELMDLVFPEDRAAVLKRLEDRLAGKRVPPRRECRLRRRDGATIWIDGFSSRIEYEGKPAIQIAFLDITEQKRVEEELRESRNRCFELAERQLGDFERLRAEAEKLAATGRMAARIAHEINNPLAGIKNAFRLVRNALPADHPDRDMADRIEKEIDRIAGVVRQMYTLHSPRADSIVESRVGETVRDVLMMLEPLARKHEVEIRLQPVPPHLSVTAPAGSLQQVVYNLVANAVEASPEGAQVSISVDAEGRHVRLTVRDRGCGIPAEVGLRVFDPFFSTKNDDTSQAGMGLGLAVVKGIVDSLGGNVRFESTTGAGTLFQVLLPKRVPQTKGQERCATTAAS